MASTGVRVQVDADIAIFPDTFFQLWNAGGGIHARALRQHGSGNEVIREQPTHAIAQLVANTGPRCAGVEVANVVGHKTGARAEDGEVGAALAHQAKLIGLDRFAQLVVADFQVSDFGTQFGRVEVGDLCIAPVLQRFGGGGVVAVAIDDQ